MILRYLWDVTDETRTVSIKELKEFLYENEVYADRKTIGKDIDVLIDFGFDIVKIRKTQNQYFLASRHFEAPEVKMLIDAVQSAKFITPKKSKELIEKLSAFVAPNQTSVLKRHLYVDSRNKAQNETIYIVADSVQTAITENKKITFQYFDYNVNGEQIPRHDGEYYIVSPYDLLWSNDTYYLAGLHEKKGIVAKFRVDRIKNLEVSQEVAREKPSDYSVAEFFNHEFSMFDGEDCKVTLLCENTLMNSMVDRFGTDISSEIVDENHFKITVDVDLSSLFYGWVFASEGRMKIISPKKAVEGFKNTIKPYK